MNEDHMDDGDVEDDDYGQDYDSIMTSNSRSPEIHLNSSTFLTIALDLRMRRIPIPLFVCYETPSPAIFNIGSGPSCCYVPKLVALLTQTPDILRF